MLQHSTTITKCEEQTNNPGSKNSAAMTVWFIQYSYQSNVLIETVCMCCVCKIDFK